jgi:hypothetical protein
VRVGVGGVSWYVCVLMPEGRRGWRGAVGGEGVMAA